MGDDTTTPTDEYTVAIDWAINPPVLTSTALPLAFTAGTIVPEKRNPICKHLTNGDIVVDTRNIKQGYVHINGKFHQMYSQHSESRGCSYPNHPFKKVGNIRKLFNEFVLEKL